MKIDEAEFESDKDLLKEKILEKIGNKKNGTIKLSTFDMGSLKKTDNEEGEYFSFDTYSEEKDLPKIIKAIEKESELGKIKLKTKAPKKEKREWVDPLGDKEKMSFNVYDIEFDLEQKAYGKEYVRKITFISDDIDLKTPEKFNRFFINENHKAIAKIREKSSIRSLIEYKIKSYIFTEKEYKQLLYKNSGLYMNNKYLVSEIIIRKNKREYLLSNKINIELITQAKYNNILKIK